jgi:hypothetical protein
MTKKISCAFPLISLIIFASCGQNPERFDCGTGSNLSIEQRIDQCNETKALSNGQELSLVARKHIQTTLDKTSTLETSHQFGEVQEFHKDPITSLIWQTSINNLALTQNDAKKMCENKKTLNFKWRLPTHTEYLKFGNLNDKENKNENNQIKEIFESTFDKRYISGFHFWTSSIAPTNNKALSNPINKRPLIFKNTRSEMASTSSNDAFLVQCVSDGTLAPKETEKNKKSK